MIKNKINNLKFKMLSLKFSNRPNNKILKFKHKASNILSDEDIKCLFVGLINLIKSNAQKQADDFYRLKIIRYQSMIDSANIQLEKLKVQLKNLEEKSYNNL